MHLLIATTLSVALTGSCSGPCSSTCSLESCFENGGFCAYINGALCGHCGCTQCAAKCEQPNSCFHDGVYADMHDGDQKKITSLSHSIKIEPYNNTETWTIVAAVDFLSCNASINFNVPGKPGPPPVPLTASGYLANSLAPRPSHPAMRDIVLFSDPSGTIAGPTMLLNTWVRVGTGVDRGH